MYEEDTGWDVNNVTPNVINEKDVVLRVEHMILLEQHFRSIFLRFSLHGHSLKTRQILLNVLFRKLLSVKKELRTLSNIYYEAFL